LFLAGKLGYSSREMPIDWFFDTDTRVRPGIDSLSMLREVFLVRVRDLLGRYDRLPAGREVGETRA
jgi:hypothetical protein